MNIPRILGSRASLLGIVLGLAYGVLARFVVDSERFGEAFGVMTFSFLVLVPLAIGFLAVHPVRTPSLRYRLFAPWVPVALTVAAAWLAGWEGSICIVMGLPLLLVLSSVGGLAAGFLASRGAAFALAVLPFAAAPLEQGIPAPARVQVNVTETTVRAPAAAVWRQVVRVDSIREAERRPALFTALGFPRPVDAVLDRSGVGATRHARFEGRVTFVETVTDWREERMLSFTIDPLTDRIPPTTLDPHVTIGGEFFDVLDGTYTLHPLADGSTRVVLSSRHRVSTRFNPYAGLWAGLVMRSIQRNILHVVRERAERSS